MINSLSMLVHIPLINISYPANMQIFMSFLVGISNFDLLPNDFISESLIEFTSTDAYNPQFKEMDILNFSSFPNFLTLLTI